MKYLAGLLILVACASARAGTYVHFDTNMGGFDVQLIDPAAPITCANFLKYTTDGDYTNTFIHRSIPGFVVQGGGFGWTDTAGGWLVLTDAPIQDEPGISNSRGTISMAKTTDPNSATSQWFFNLVDNTSLDYTSTNSGYTAFGRVVGNGMSVIDAIAALTVYDGSSIYQAFTNLPLKGPYFDQAHLVMINSVTVEKLGDANRNGRVDDNDLNVLLSSWGTGADWTHGNFKDAGVVDDNDLNSLLSNWTGSAAAVPEPITLALLAIGALDTIRRSKKA